MDDAGLVLALAFGGDDAARALWLPALASLLVTARLRVRVVAILAFLLDRALPYAGLLDTHGRDAVLASLAYQASALPQDAIWLAVRLGGFFAVTAFCWRLRLALHGRRPVTQTVPGAARA